MIRTNAVVTKLFALTLALGAASTSAYAWPHLASAHRHPVVDSQPDTRISITLVNPGRGFRDVKVDGHVYTIQSHETLTITAPAGTAVYADNTGSGYRKGDLMFAVTPDLQGKTKSVNN